MCAPCFTGFPELFPLSKERQHYMPQYPIIPHEQMGILQKPLCSHMEHVLYMNIWGSYTETMFPWEHRGLDQYDIWERRGFYIKLMDIWAYRFFPIGSSWCGYLCAAGTMHVTSLWWCKWPLCDEECTGFWKFQMVWWRILVQYFADTIVTARSVHCACL